MQPTIAAVTAVRRVLALSRSSASAPHVARQYAIVALWALACWQWVVSDSVVPWDSKNQFYAFFRFLAESLHAGTSVFWNPYHYGGHPSIADPQSLVFSPPFLLWALFDRAPSLSSFDLIVMLHLAGWRPRDRRSGRASRLDGGGDSHVGCDLHARWCCLGTVEPHRHHHLLRIVPAGTADAGDLAGALLLPLGAGVRAGCCHDRARPQSGCADAVPGACRLCHPRGGARTGFGRTICPRRRGVLAVMAVAGSCADRQYRCC